MTIPPQKLRLALVPGACLQLRSESGETAGMIEYTDAVSRAMRCEIEGVCSNTGVVRYVRALSAEMRHAMTANEETVGHDRHERSKAHPLNAITDLGAYQQELSTGRVWSLKLCKSLDGARA